jgi:hypothetical protein
MAVGPEGELRAARGDVVASAAAGVTHPPQRRASGDHVSVDAAMLNRPYTVLFQLQTTWEPLALACSS